MRSRPLSSIPVDELRHYSVWEYDLEERDNAEEQDETWIHPVTSLPVDDLENRLVVTGIELSSGLHVTGILGNIDLQDLRKTKEFICLSVEKAGKWFTMERYFDPLYDEMGPSALAEFLGLPVGEVFPVYYDISGIAIGNGEVLHGEIRAEPEQRLTDDERWQLIMAG